MIVYEHAVRRTNDLSARVNENIPHVTASMYKVYALGTLSIIGCCCRDVGIWGYLSLFLRPGVFWPLHARPPQDSLPSTGSPESPRARARACV